MPSIGMGQVISDVGQSIADLEETDKSQRQVWAVGKTQNRGGTQKAKGFPIGCKNNPVKITWKQMWFDLVAMGISHEEICPQPNAVLVGPWKALKIGTIVQTCPICSTIPEALPAPAETSGIIPIQSGCVPCPG